MSPTPESVRVTHVAAFVVVRSTILIHRRSPNRRFLPSAWDLVGGRIEPDESPLEALRREGREETGVAVQHVGPWITRSSFELEGARCVEIGALVWCESDRFELEASKSIAFAFVEDPKPFADDNEIRGYGRHLEQPLHTALLALDTAPSDGRQKERTESICQPSGT